MAAISRDVVVVIDRMLRAIGDLETLPYRFSRVQDPARSEALRRRRIVVDGYILCYQIDEPNRMAPILPVRYGSRQAWAFWHAAVGYLTPFESASRFALQFEVGLS